MIAVPRVNVGVSFRAAACLRASLAVIVALVALAGCGSAPPRPGPKPAGDQLLSVGEQVFRAVRGGRVDALLAPEAFLESDVTSKARTRYRILAGAPRHRGDLDRTLLNEAEYEGACITGLRAEPEGGRLGLKIPRWVFDRILVVGLLPSGKRVALWLHGVFVRSDGGFRLLEIAQIENPRWEHADIQLAVCDAEPGLERARDRALIR